MRHRKGCMGVVWDKDMVFQIQVEIEDYGWDISMQYTLDGSLLILNRTYDEFWSSTECMLGLDINQMHELFERVSFWQPCSNDALYARFRGFRELL